MLQTMKEQIITGMNMMKINTDKVLDSFGTTDASGIVLKAIDIAIWALLIYGVFFGLKMGSKVLNDREAVGDVLQDSTFRIVFIVGSIVILSVIKSFV